MDSCFLKCISVSVFRNNYSTITCLIEILGILESCQTATLEPEKTTSVLKFDSHISQ